MYEITILRRALRDIQNLPHEYARLVVEHVDGFAQNPRPPGAKKLKERSDYSLRVGVYRILYEIDDERMTVTVYRVRHRREAYR